MPPRRHSKLYGGRLIPPGGIAGRGTGQDVGAHIGGWLGNKAEPWIHETFGPTFGFGQKKKQTRKHPGKIGRGKHPMIRGRGKYGQFVGNYVGGLSGVPFANEILGKIGNDFGDDVYDFLGFNKGKLKGNWIADLLNKLGDAFR